MSITIPPTSLLHPKVFCLNNSSEIASLLYLLGYQVCWDLQVGKQEFQKLYGRTIVQYDALVGDIWADIYLTLQREYPDSYFLCNIPELDQSQKGSLPQSIQTFFKKHPKRCLCLESGSEVSLTEQLAKLALFLGRPNPVLKEIPSSTSTPNIMLQVHQQQPVSGIAHYYHHLCDFVIPIFTYLSQQQKTEKKTYYVQGYGPFAHQITELLPQYDLKFLSLDDPQPEDRNIYFNQWISLNDFNTAFTDLTPAALSMREHLLDLFQIQTSPPYNKDKDKDKDEFPIVLIQRGKPHLYHTQHKATAGYQRRSILNHAQLKEALEKHFNAEIVNLKLEEVPFREQVLLFNRARMVIGQHGAGLTNLIWTRDNATVVEIGGQAHAPYYQRIAENRGLKHINYPLYDHFGYVKIPHFLEFLTTNNIT